MKAYRSSLDANAASYIPLCERSVVENKDRLLLTTSEVAVSIKAPENYRNHLNVTSHGSSSKSPKNKDVFDEDFDMDLAYIQMSFPGYSNECLSHMYLANSRDLQHTVDMLNQLEFCNGETGENLPDTLEIGDTSESQSSKECTRL